MQITEIWDIDGYTSYKGSGHQTVIGLLLPI